MATGNGLVFELVDTSDEGITKIDRILKKL